jgi:DNA-binding FrmR family transcriptional regulator
MRKHMQKWRLVYMEQNKINGNNNTEVKCCCCGGNVKKTERAEKDKKKLVNRLSRIEGQIRGIKKMIENDAYCNDVLIQSAAVGAAINAFNRELLSNHIHSCVVRDIREGKDEVVDELMLTLQKLIK